MSDEPTKEIAEKYDTKPTIETVLERINALGAQLNARIDSLEKRFDSLEEHVGSLEKRFDIRLDRIESEVKLTHSEVYALRADLKESKVHEPR